MTLLMGGPLTSINSPGVPTSDCVPLISQLIVTVGFMAEDSGLGFDTVGWRVGPSIVKDHIAFIFRG